MKPKTLLQGGLAALLLLALPPAWSQQMNYQGRLTDASGNPLADGQQVLTFSFYDAATGGNLIWGPFIADGGAGNGRGPLATIVNGRFNIALGPLDTAGRALNTSFNGDRYLEIKIAANSPITPRQKLLAAPLALKADIAATVVNGAIGTAQLADGSVTAAKLNSATGIWLTNPAGTYRDTGNGGVGIGNALPLNPASPTTANPGTRLQVNSLQYGSAPTAIFESSNCGLPCGQPAWTETIRLWNSNSNGRTGIGFMSRASGAINAAPDVYAGTGDIAGSGSRDFRIATNVSGTLTDRLYINGSNGAVSLNTTDSSAGFVVKGGGQNGQFPLKIIDRNGDVFIETFAQTSASGGIGQFSLNYGSALKPGGGSWTAISDVRVKKNIHDLKSGLDRLTSLHPVTFEYTNGKSQGAEGVQIGFIAQEVEKVFPQWVEERPNHTPHHPGDAPEPAVLKQLSIKGFEALAVASFQELRAEKDAQINSLKAENAALAARLAALEKSVATLAALDRPADPARKETAGR